MKEDAAWKARVHSQDSYGTVYDQGYLSSDEGPRSCLERTVVLSYEDLKFITSFTLKTTAINMPTYLREF